MQEIYCFPLVRLGVHHWLQVFSDSATHQNGYHHYQEAAQCNITLNPFRDLIINIYQYLIFS